MHFDMHGLKNMRVATLERRISSVSSQNKCEYGLLRANWPRTVAHYLRMKDGDLSLRALILLASEAFIVDV
jgi:hypothetical protein